MIKLNKKTKIAILNTGWLGAGLASALQNQAVSLHLGYRLLPKKEPSKFQIVVSKQGLEGDIAAFLDVETCVITLPFKRSFVDPFDYVTWMDHVARALEKSPVKHVIFSSSTSIYPKLAGHYNETDALAQDERANALREAEIRLLSLNKRVCVLRLAGLWGADRKLTRMLEHQPISHPQKNLNLVHKDDVVSAIGWVLEKQLTGVFNVVSPRHPTRKDYYERLASHLNVEQPFFEEAYDASDARTVNPDALIKTGFSYQYPNPLGFFDSKRLS